MMAEFKKVVLAYSGGLDTSVIIPWLKENYGGCEVIACCADIGQGDDMQAIHDKALRSGASKCYILDLTQEFLEEYVWPTLKAGAVYEGKYLLGTSFARPLIAKRLVEVAKKEGAEAIAHGATGKGNDQVRFELTVKALAPNMAIVAPWREWDLLSRTQEIEYAKAHNIDIPTDNKKYSMDKNIWHLSHEGSDLEDPWNEPQNEMYLVSKAPEDAADKPEYVTIDFEKGIPVAVNGKKMGAVELLTELNDIGARNGVGIVDICENRLVGMKSRGVYENPGGAILFYAHRELEYLCLDRATYHYKEGVAIRFGELVYDGMWFCQLREALSAFVDSTQETVTGTVKLKLYKGNIMSAGAKSPYSLYNQEFVTFEEDHVYNQADAEGFINLFGLPLKVRALMQEKAGK
ncbi:MAG: argininosuccinate synthase [Anaerovibrio sp.]|uniref:argininosuccinate synthase n=2 Tax=Anaerovibrio TaxID=82373 RepID=UPI0023F37C13|nr:MULTISPECIES: argininosuccinate synthase [Anaerovibrio]MBQ2410590.1 argininosuccinate synthase [Selenomonadaceae bacterium]MBQ5586510.1 argininosuccinate synthase [Selenomonadaceae bacterium]MBQ5650396.1 argininosuccinate synthase [Selenomonadaceae bacterium]MBQ5733468.1 argininosuccinate synthase [Selenomonadaceae bacterium]MBQ5919502.1 argininosuccinate synthase [Selenomonadaceae bacterium]